MQSWQQLSRGYSAHFVSVGNLCLYSVRRLWCACRILNLEVCEIAYPPVLREASTLAFPGPFCVTWRFPGHQQPVKRHGELVVLSEGFPVQISRKIWAELTGLSLQQLHRLFRILRSGHFPDHGDFDSLHCVPVTDFYTHLWLLSPQEADSERAPCPLKEITGPGLRERTCLWGHR